MAPPSPDDSVFEEEVDLRTDVRIAIDLARRDVLDDPDASELTDVKEQKLTHFAIRDLNLPLTHSWYLAGGYTAAQPAVTGSTWSPGQSFGGIQAQEPEYSERIDELRTYFRSEEFMPGYTLRSVQYTDKFDFLRDYYRELAPEKYRDLYLHSLDVREALWNLRRVVESESANAALSEFGVGEPGMLLSASKEESFRRRVSDLHVAIAEVDELATTKSEVVRGTDAIELVLAKLTHLDSTTAEQESVLRRGIHDFFYYHVWKYPALAISADTASGPNAETLRQQRLLELNEFDDRLSTRTAAFTRNARSVGLLPDVDERLAEPDDRTTYLHALLRESVDHR